MKILAKSILNPDQLEVRKSLDVDGIEILLLSKDWINKKATETMLKDATKEWKVIALEAPDCFEDGSVIIPINPASNDKVTQTKSKDFLKEFVEFANLTKARGITVPYAQFQFTFKQYDQDGHTPRADHQLTIHQLAEFYSELQKNTDIPLQIENSILIGAPLNSKVFHYHTACNLKDFEDTNILLALDIAHLSQTIHTYTEATKTGEKYKIIVNKKYYYLPLSPADIQIRNRIKKRKGKLEERITAELLYQIATYRPQIGSMQFSGAKGFGFNKEDAGTSDPGIFDLDQVLSAAIKADVPYLIPEFLEVNYLNPINQIAAIKMVRSLIR